MYILFREEIYKELAELIGELDVIRSGNVVLVPGDDYSDIILDLLDLISLDREHIDDLEYENNQLKNQIPPVLDVKRGNYF